MTQNALCPRARAERTRVEELGAELLVYDLDQHRAHHLNAVAAAVWRRADGTVSVTELTVRVAESCNVPADSELIWHALDQLDHQGLLAEPLPDRRDARTTRRQLVRRLGLAAAALPLVTTLVMRASAQQFSPGETGPTGTAPTPTPTPPPPVA